MKTKNIGFWVIAVLTANLLAVPLAYSGDVDLTGETHARPGRVDGDT